ncbi:hypothetical protein HYE60_00700 [Aggregatibacter actinomycetemcomitans]|uniref:hypothetical protein n=1 Tax=Aggregatibacter actinomycetemcomitans TaxID=714 RepID=UPI00197B9E95|nr:hypothetical protein [Aggregatibacter actinomycetemcomitans]MBN6073805.1 hypothetical protein [Aggregatibacter actinomycetemcomitans]
MKYFFYIFSILLLGCNSAELFKETELNLSEAKFSVPYLNQIKFTDRPSYHSNFIINITPIDSGLTAKPENEWYDTVIVSGIPKTNESIYIDIHYTVRGPVHRGENPRKSKRYKIEVTK